jgi:hypothetical protein
VTVENFFHFTYIEGAGPGGLPLFRCETCKQIMGRGVMTHAENHGPGHVIVDSFTTLDQDQTRRIMEEVNKTAVLKYRILEATDRDDIPAYQCTECDEKLIALSLAAHLRVHGATTYKIDSTSIVSPHLVAVEETVEKLRRLINLTYLSSRERSLAQTKLDETELWLSKCQESNLSA